MFSHYMSDQINYKPPLSYHQLTRFYDLILRHGLREALWKQALVRQVDVSDGNRILDLGCGTGTLTLMLHRANPVSDVVGIDADTKALKIALSKANGTSIRFVHSLSTRLPYTKQSFDKVVCS